MSDQPAQGLQDYAQGVMEDPSLGFLHSHLNAPSSRPLSASIHDFQNVEGVESRGSQGDNGFSEKDSEPQRRVTSISSLYSICIRNMNTVISLASNASQETDIQEQCGRLQIWAGNHGAHRTPNDRMSLDYRLREAQDLHQEVIDHFNDLIKALEETAAIASGVVSTPDQQDSYSSSSGSDESLTESQKLLIGAPTLAKESSSGDIHHNLVQTMDDIITSLYKFSITIQNPTRRDRTARASKIDVSFWKDIDQGHVLDKFSKCNDRVLLRGLAEANTKRRQLFAYHKRHSDKIQYFEDTTVEPIRMEEPGKLEKPGDSSRPVLLGAIAPTVHTSKTKLTETTVSTAKPAVKRIAPSISGRSQRTYISKFFNSNDENSLKIPAPPNQAKVFKNAFFCPYCFSTIDPKDTRDWEIHVLDDLRPYVCTFGDCVTSDRLYDRFSEWSMHELEVHRKEWFCNSCDVIFDTKCGFGKHLRLAHKDLFADEEEFGALISLCERRNTDNHDCALCSDFTGDSNAIQKQLAGHLKRLALYTLPKLNNEMNDESEAGSAEAQVNALKQGKSGSTQKERQEMSDENFEEYPEFIRGWMSPLGNSPVQSVSELEDPMSWEFCKETRTAKQLGDDEQALQALMESFTRAEGKKLEQGPGTTNLDLSYRIKYSFLFKWKHPASEVFVTGTFDNWSKSERLERVKDTFVKDVTLASAERVFYKFVVDGNWVVDHTAPVEHDEAGNGNNIITSDEIMKQASLIAPTANQKPQRIPAVPYHNLPRPPNRNFVGRQDVLAELDRMLQEPVTNPVASRLLPPVSLTGRAGIGKTEIAMEFAFSHMNDFDVVLWISAAGSVAISEGFNAIATQMGLRSSDDNLDPVSCRQLVLGWLSNPVGFSSHSHKICSWLLIFDHVEDFDLLLDFFPLASNTGAVIITCRDMRVARVSKGEIKIEPFSLENSFEFLRKLNLSDYGEEESHAMATIVGRHGCVPGALSSMAMVMMMKNFSFVDFLEYDNEQEGHDSTRILRVGDGHLADGISAVQLPSFDISLSLTDDTESSFRVQNEGSAALKRIDFMERESAMYIHCSFLDVVHGLFSAEGDDLATLIVLQLNLDASKQTRIFGSMTFWVEFGGGETEIEVFAIAPMGMHTLLRPKQHEGGIRSIKVSDSVGWIEAARGMWRDGAIVAGSISKRRHSGGSNSASWDLQEKSDHEIQLLTSMRTTVLLKRKDRGPFVCMFGIEARAGHQWMRGRTSIDEPIVFDPTLGLTHNLQKYDIQALGSVDLDRMWEVKLATNSEGIVKQNVAEDYADPSSRKQFEQHHRWLNCMDEFADFIQNTDSPGDVQGVSIALIDDGVDYGDQSPGNNIVGGQSFRGVTEGQIHEPYYISRSGHGSAMAGLICRVFPKARLYVVKLDECVNEDMRRYITAQSAAKAVRSAVERKVDIISMAWTIEKTPTSAAGIAEFETAIDIAAQAGILMFCAANDRGTVSGEAYPAGWCAKDLFRIGAAHASGAELGWVGDSSDVDFIFPGSYATKNDSDHIFTPTGSSVATALATGLAGLILYCVRLAALYMKLMNRSDVTIEDFIALKRHERMREAFLLIGERNKYIEVWRLFKEALNKAQSTGRDERREVVIDVAKRLLARSMFETQSS